MKKLIIVPLLILSFVSYGFSNEKEISSLMVKYWEAWGSGDVELTSRFISPQELEEARRILVPIFLKCERSDKDDIRRIAHNFFDGKSPRDISEVSGREVYLGMMRVASAAGNDLTQVAQQTKLKTGEIYYKDENNAVLNYTAYMGEVPILYEYIRVEKIMGSWFLCYTEPLEITASKLSLIFK